MFADRVRFFTFIYLVDGKSEKQMCFSVCAFFAFTVDWRDARCLEMREIASNYNDPLQRAGSFVIPHCEI
jgi:hypothetical protein